MRPTPTWLNDPSLMAVADAAVAEYMTCSQGLPSRILGSADAYMHVMECLRTHDLTRENLVVLAVNRRHAPVDVSVLTSGNETHTIVDPKQILRHVLTRARPCSAFILAHNHPSGDPTPSSNDVDVTTHVAKAAHVVGLELLDHLVLGAGGFCSLREKDLLRGAPKSSGVCMS